MRECSAKMMKKYHFNFQFKPWVAATALLCSVGGAGALTIDRPVGGVVLGKPLDLSVKVSRSPQEEFDGLCAQVDVLFGETLQGAGRVIVATEPAASGNEFTLRVRSSGMVDEPIVSLAVQVGCKQIVSRRFVLLSELPAEVRTPSPAPVLAVPYIAPQRPVPVVLPATDQAVDEATARPVVTEKPVSVVRKKPPVLAAAPSSATTPVARLRLAPIDLSQDWEPVLQVSTELLSEPVEDEAKRQEAAVLWRYLNLSPKDMMRLNTQEQELAQLKRTMAGSQLQMQELNQQLQIAEKERYANPLVYGLSALIVLLLGGFAYFYHRVVGQGAIQRDWWKTPLRDSEFKPSEFSGDSELAVSESLDSRASRKTLGQDASPAQPDAAGVKPKVKPSGAAEPVAVPQSSGTEAVIDDLDFVIDAEPDIPAPVAQAAPSPSDGLRDFENSITASMRSINTHDMLDVRQQAEFFMTLGQYEEAIDLLQSSLSQSDDANPLVYLDLLKMLHTLSRRTEFDSIRKTFNRIFSGRVPPYAVFNEPSEGLENYPELCNLIAANWATGQAVALIEAALVRGTDMVESGRIELEAFRDLLMLHAIAQYLVGNHDSAEASTFIAAKSAVDAMPDFADSEPMMLDLPFDAEDTPVAIEPATAEAVTSNDPIAYEAPDLLLPPTFESPAPAAVDLDLSDNNSNLIDFDPTIFSLDLPATQADEEKK
jgi:pilus assembly protein FimV